MQWDIAAATKPLSGIAALTSRLHADSARLTGPLSSPKHMTLITMCIVFICRCSTGSEAATAIPAMIHAIKKMAEDAMPAKLFPKKHSHICRCTTLQPCCQCWQRSSCYQGCYAGRWQIVTQHLACIRHIVWHVVNKFLQGLAKQEDAVNCTQQGDKQLLST